MNFTDNFSGMKTVTSNVIDTTLTNSFIAINLLSLAEVIGLFGIAANIINVIVFRRQHHQQDGGINVTLTSLAISDLGALVTQQVSNIFVNPWIGETDLVLLKTHLFIITIYMHGYFIRVSGIITVFASMERCLCVMLPLKVKNIISPLTARVICFAIFVVCILYLAPLYLIVYIDWRSVPGTNRSILSMYFRDNRETVFSYYYFIADMFVPYATIFALILFTTFMIRKLKTQRKWRERTVRSGRHRSDVMSHKQRSVTLMLSAVSVIFILCLTPHSALNTALGIVREMKVDGQYAYMYYIVYSCCALLETINCSVTIFVYFKMSTKYKEEFFKLVRWLGKITSEENSCSEIKY